MIRVIKNKFIILMLLVCVLSAGRAYAQDDIPAWKISVGGGYMNYFGDVSPYTIKHWEDWDNIFKFFQYNKYYMPTASFGLSIERYLTPGIGLRLQLNEGKISMSDRYRNPGGTYDKDAIHWNRALNFETTIQDVGLDFVFRSNNGRMFPVNSFLAPYFFIGGGVTHFKVKGDLYDADGNPYVYANPNVKPDGVYETDLRPLMTETSKEYPDVVPYVGAGLGLSLNMGKIVSLAIQTNVKYAFSDYLDDVSSKYKTKYNSPEAAYAAHPGTNVVGPYNPNRGNNDGVNDFYIFNKISLSFNLGNKANRYFHAPVIYQPGTFMSVDSVYTGNVADSTYRQPLDSAQMAGGEVGDTAHQQAESTLQQIKSDLVSLRFAHIDQGYIIRQNAIQNEMNRLAADRDKLLSNANKTTADSLRARLYDYQMDSLRNALEAVHQARVQLRKDMAYSPVVTEYQDSTKIMIYKGRPGNGDSAYLPVIGTPYLKKDSVNAYTLPDESRERPQPYLTPADSIRMALSQLQHNASANRDTALSHRLEVIQRRLDSIDATRNVETNQNTDSLENAYYIQQDSLRILELNRQADSLRQLNRIRMTEQAPKRNAIQRFFDKFKWKKNQAAEADQYQNYRENTDTTSYYQGITDSLNSVRSDYFNQNMSDTNNTFYSANPVDTSNVILPPDNTSKYDQNNPNYLSTPVSPQYTASTPDQATSRLLQQNQDEISRLQEEIRDLRSYSSRNNRQSTPTVIFRDNNDNSSARQERRNRRQMSELNRDMIAAIAGSNQRAPAAVSPNIILPPAYSSNNDNTQELDDIRRQLDALKAQYDTSNAANEAWAQGMLTDTSARSNAANGERVGLLQAKVDSLSRQLATLKQDTSSKAPEATKASDEKTFLANYPVVSVYFPTGSSSLSADAKGKIKPIATVAKQYPDAKLSITGYTDGTGNKQVNERLSAARCAAVKQILTRQYGIGEQRLVTDANTAAERGSGNPLKRRVDVRFID